MCNRCANLENRLSYDRIQAIRRTDRYRGSKEHEADMKRLFGDRENKEKRDDRTNSKELRERDLQAGSNG